MYQEDMCMFGIYMNKSEEKDRGMRQCQMPIHDITLDTT